MTNVIKKIRTNGLKLNMEKMTEEQRADVFAATLTLAQEGVSIFGGYENGKLLETVICQRDAVEKVEKAFGSKYGQDDQHNYDDAEFGVKQENLDKLFNTIGLETEWKNYQARNVLVQKDNTASSADEFRQLSNLGKVITLPEQDGKLILAVDEEGNMFKAAVRCQNDIGELRYEVFMVTSEGYRKKGIVLGPDEVQAQTTKIGNKIKRANAKFTGADALIATQRLWMWDYIRQFVPEEPMWDDLDHTQIKEALIEYVGSNIEEEVRKVLTSEDVKGDLYIYKVKGEIEIGIWAESFEKVFLEKLHVRNIKSGSWVKTAISEGWLKPNVRNNRNAHSTSRQQTGLYNRDSKDERVYLLEWPSPKELAAIYEKVEEEIKAAKIKKKVMTTATTKEKNGKKLPEAPVTAKIKQGVDVLADEGDKKSEFC